MLRYVPILQDHSPAVVRRDIIYLVMPAMVRVLYLAQSVTDNVHLPQNGTFHEKHYLAGTVDITKISSTRGQDD